MSLGAGLGGFVDGLESGMKMRERYDENKEKREKKAAIKQINSDTKSAFAEAQAAGVVSDGDYEAFWTKYALPKLKMQYLESGDMASAKAITEWGESEAALKGGKLFASAMQKANSGDAGGALKDAIAAGQTNGYIDHKYTLVGQDELRDKDGNLRGYRVTVKDGDGKERSQDVKPENLQEFIANALNPVAAGQSQIAARQKAAADEKKQKDDLTLHEGKKAIDQKYSKDQSPETAAKAYSDAKNNLAKNDMNFVDLSEEEQDKAVRAELGRAKAYGNEAAGVTGITKPSAPKRMVVNTKTGKVVEAPAPASATPPMSPDQVKTVAPGIQAAPAAQSRQPAMTTDDRIKDASMQLQGGANPEYIKQQLLNDGVAEDLWPEALKKNQKQAGVVGIGQ